MFGYFEIKYIIFIQVKKTSTWNKACEELKRHQDLLEKLRVATNNFSMPLSDSSSDESDIESIKVSNFFCYV